MEPTPALDERKVCSKCGESKPLRLFARGRRGAFAGDCKTCRAEYMRNYRQSNPEQREKAIARSAAYYRQNREAMIAAATEYQRKNPRDPDVRRQRDRARYAANPDLARTKKYAWMAANADSVAETRRRTMSRRRARLRGLPVEPYTMDLLERDGTACVLCGEELALDAVFPDQLSPTVEHLECIAWPDSPGDVLSNVAVAHYRCNNRRRARPHPAAARKRAELLAAIG